MLAKHLLMAYWIKNAWRSLYVRMHFKKRCCSDSPRSALWSVRVFITLYVIFRCKFHVHNLQLLNSCAFQWILLQVGMEFSVLPWCGNIWRPTKSRDCLFRDCYSKGISYHCLHFSKDWKASRRVGKLYSGKKGRFQVYSDWRLLAWGSW